MTSKIQGALASGYIGDAYRWERGEEHVVPAHLWVKSAATCHPGHLSSLLCVPVLWVISAPKKWYWSAVARKEIFAWEGMHSALIGVGRFLGSDLSSVYDKNRILAQLELEAASRVGSGKLVGGKVRDKMEEIVFEKDMYRLPLKNPPWYVKTLIG
jgi:hypothetical protein